MNYVAFGRENDVFSKNTKVDYAGNGTFVRDLSDSVDKFPVLLWNPHMSHR